MSVRYSHLVRLGLALFTSFALLGCQGCQGSGSEAASQNGDKAAEEAQAESPESGESSASDEPSSSGDENGSKAESAPPDDLYPGMEFGKLDADARRTFVSIAKSELCPCEGSNQSLHACLQSEAKRCMIAKRMSSLAIAGIQSGLNETDIRDRMAKFAERAGKRYEFNLENTPRKGPKDAEVVIVEFADFQCPHCKEAVKILEKIHSKFEGQIAHYFKHFPLSGHGKARMAARATVAAHTQGKFWPMHDLIFKHQRSISKQKVFRFARQIGLNFEKFKKDFNSPSASKTVEQHRSEGRRVGVGGTPAIFINGRRYMGPQTEEAITSAVQSTLDEAGSEK